MEKYTLGFGDDTEAIVSEVTLEERGRALATPRRFGRGRLPSTAGHRPPVDASTRRPASRAVTGLIQFSYSDLRLEIPEAAPSEVIQKEDTL